MDVIQEIDEFGEHFHEDEVMPKIPSANSRKSCWKSYETDICSPFMPYKPKTL